MKFSLNLKDPQTAKIWDAISRIPDEVLEGYLADNIIDEDEIDDLIRRLEEVCQTHDMGLSLDQTGSALLRTLIHAAVEKIQADRSTWQPTQKPGKIEDRLSAVSLRDIKSAMGQLLASGQISSDVQHVSRATNVAYSDDLPDHKPEPKKDENDDGNAPDPTNLDI